MECKVISRCPVCSGKMKVIKLKCSGCSTVIENNFALSKFEYLSAEQLNFIETFVSCRGNIKDVEREIGVSYPTVRAKLDDVIDALGYQTVKKPSVDSKNVIDMLERGEITADQALNMLKED
jgi:hypothetical protein